MRTLKESLNSCVEFSLYMGELSFDEKERKKLIKFLKENGLVIIFNQPGRTFDFAEHSLDADGVESNEELEEILEELNMKELYKMITKEGYFVGVYQK